jgi:hypothetical protein
MCDLALLGAQTDALVLRNLLALPDWEFDTDVIPDARGLARFPRSDTVVCLTMGGCSCVLLRGLGIDGGAGSDAHLAGPGYMFRRALAAATLRFGSVRLLRYNLSKPGDATSRRVTTLAQLLRTGLRLDDQLLHIIA